MRRLIALSIIAAAAIFAASWWATRRPYVTPGSHQIFHMDSTLGAMLEFVVILSLVFAGIVSLAGAVRAIRVFAAIAGSYLLAVVLVSLLTPRTVVSIGDSYCWDLWCVGIQNVSTVQQGQNALYRVDVSIFADTETPRQVPADEARQFFYVLDDQGRRFRILPESSFVDANVTVKPGEPAKSSLAFLAPANARELYLTGDMSAPFWVRLYFGSDLNPWHRRTLLRVV